MLLIDYARQVGVAMGSIAWGTHIGWTTDPKKMEKLRDAGAHVDQGYGAPMGVHSAKAVPKSADTPMGWEISFARGREVIEA